MHRNNFPAILLFMKNVELINGGPRTMSREHKEFLVAARAELNQVMKLHKELKTKMMNLLVG